MEKNFPILPMKRYLFAALILPLALAWPQAQADGIAALQAFFRDVHSARSVFTQTVTDKNGHVSQRASGTMLFARPGKFRWSYHAPYRQLIVGDGKRFWLYDEDLQQITTRALGASLGSSPAALLAGDNDLEKYFQLRDLPSSDGLEWVEALPRAKDSSFKSVRMGFSGSTPAEMVLSDNFGQTTVLKFAHVEKNPAIPAREFRFVPPKGVDVLAE